MKSAVTFPLVAAAVLLCSMAGTKAAVITYIDTLKTTQTANALNSTVTNTVAASGAIGGFRTLTLNSADNDPDLPPSAMRVSTNAPIGPRFSLSTPTDATTSFEIKWGGANGTSGIGPVDLTGGSGPMFTLINSFVNFSLRSADVPGSSFTWSFTDTANNVASYSGTFPSQSSTNPAISYAIQLASFSGSGIIDWKSINFITLSGGGLELDLSLPAPMYVTAAVPEPGTWAVGILLLCGAAVFTLRRRRQDATAETVTAA